MSVGEVGRGTLTAGAILLVCATAAAALPSSPTLVQDGSFDIASPAPIYQGITRFAFPHVTPDGYTVNFSTLESYHVNPNGDRFVLYQYNTTTGMLHSNTVEGAIEGRSGAFSRTLNQWVVGASLDPEVLLYDPVSRAITTVFSLPAGGAWIHGLATLGEDAYTILSSPTTPVRGYDGILKINLLTRATTLIPFPDTLPQNYGGVDSVDPTGRIWFYRAFPVSERWYDAAGGMRVRTLPGYEGWSVATWDTWGDDFFVVLYGPDGRFARQRVDRQTLAVLSNPTDPLFLGLVPVDFRHRGSARLDALYWDQSTSNFYRADRENRTLTLLGSVEMGTLESPLNWAHPTLGLVRVFDLTEDDKLVLWVIGQKTYAVVDPATGLVTPHTINAPNISPAAITALAVGGDGMVYGGGYLTISDMFRLDPATGEVTALPQAIPLGEGQVNALFTGHDGLVYGTGYPHSVIFRLDPSMPWQPGRTPTSNPRNVGPLGHHNQMRARHGVQDSDGRVWFESVTDYALPIARALARVDFGTGEVVVKTDLDDGWPRVQGLTTLDDGHIVLLGETDGTMSLYSVDQRTFQIAQVRPVGGTGGGLLADVGRLSDGSPLVVLVRDALVYRVASDLTVQLIHRAQGPVVRVLRGRGDGVLLIGQYHIEMIDLIQDVWEVWWNNASDPVLSDLAWNAVVRVGGTLLVGYSSTLRRFFPPVPSSQADLITLLVRKTGGGDGAIASTPGGATCGRAECSVTVNRGQTVTLRTTPAQGSVFAGWGGACSGTDACVVRAETGASVTVAFERLQLAIVIMGTGMSDGSVSASRLGTQVTLSAMPVAGTTFRGWSDACAGSSPSCVVQDGQKTVVAVFDGPMGAFTGFTDATLSPSVLVKAAHVSELRHATDALRAAKGLARFVWTDPTLVAGSTTVKAVHLTELRTALSDVYRSLGKPAPAFTDPTLASGQSVIRSVHVRELRSATTGVQ